MQPIHHASRGSQHQCNRRGFTLIELIVALTVISVATTILFKLYMTSADLGALAQHRELAATIAESELAQVLASPSAYVWDHQNPSEQGLFRVRRNAEDPRAGRKVPLPNVLLPEDASFKRETNVFDKFRWSAYGRLPEPRSAYFEITVNVQWKESGKMENIALTSAVPRSAVVPDWVEN